MSTKLTFHGAARCVTGFCASLETPIATVLIDCGMFQGPKSLKALNYGDFPFDPREVDAVLLTHAHIDHSGLLPKLMRAGFRGPIYATAGARDLCAVMLADAGHIQEGEVRQLNSRNRRRGLAEVQPIYTAEDAGRTMALFEKVKLGEAFSPVPGFTATYWEAGHILGSASIELVVEGEQGPTRLLFSGDLGTGGGDYLPDPEGPSGVDHLIIESTYGDRERPQLNGEDRRRMLAQVLNDARAAGGPLLVPAFAVERTQELLADMLTLMEEGEAPVGDIFLDSPLAIEATEIFRERGWNRNLQRNPFADLSAGGRLRFTRSPAESDALEQLRGWHVIVAASGMCDAGRVRKHLQRLLWRRDATVLLCGFQAQGTLGRILQDGAKRVSIQGEEIRVHARVRSLDVYSAHADAAGLVRWAKARGPVQGRIYLAHGEPAAVVGLRDRLVAAGFSLDRLTAPELDDSFVIEGAEVSAPAHTARRLAPAAELADWHNARIRLLTTLNQQLEAASNDAARERLLAGLQKTLEAQEPARAGTEA